MSEQKYLIKTLGQYLYQNIKKPWLNAEIQLSYDNSRNGQEHKTRCNARFVNEDSITESIEIPVNIQQSFELLCKHAKTNSPENWQRAISYT